MQKRHFFLHRPSSFGCQRLWLGYEQRPVGPRSSVALGACTRRPQFAKLACSLWSNSHVHNYCALGARLAIMSGADRAICNVFQRLERYRADKGFFAAINT